MKDFWTYILESAYDGTHYVGSAQNVEERLKKHNNGECRFTKGHRPWRIVHREPFKTRSSAVIRERYLKTGVGRRELKELLS